MSLTFPTNPINGQFYPEPALDKYPQFEWNNATRTWVKLLEDSATGGVIFSQTAPLTRENKTALRGGEYWFNTTNGMLCLYYKDVDSGQWIQINTPSSVPGSGWESLPPILNPISNLTYVIPILDTSGSMSSYISTIETRLVELRAILKTNMYNSNEADTQKYFKSTYSRPDENYLEWMRAEYRDNVTEPKKYLFLIFQNEAGGGYHPGGPTASYTSHLSALLEVINTYSSVAFMMLPYGPLNGFMDHLNQAVNGFGGLRFPLRNLNFYIHPGLSNSNTGQDYYDIIISALNSGYVTPISIPVP